MSKGKQTCKILKEIRKQIAAENDIEFVTSECTYHGDCLGTCPKCEAEVRYLERELEKRQRMGKAAVFAGMTIGTLCAATSCERLIPRPLEGDVPYYPDSTEMQNDSISNDVFLFEGDVVDVVELAPDSWDEEGETTEGIIVPRIDDPNEPIVYMIVDEIQFIADNVKYPAEAKEKGIRGIVYVNFIVEPDGSVSDIKVLRGIGGGCDEEAVRVVESMPKFKPGIQNGEAVKVSYTVPVNFRLEDKQD